jgi:hypothetical protein
MISVVVGLGCGNATGNKVKTPQRLSEVDSEVVAQSSGDSAVVRGESDANAAVIPETPQGSIEVETPEATVVDRPIMLNAIPPVGLVQNSSEVTIPFFLDRGGQDEPKAVDFSVEISDATLVNPSTIKVSCKNILKKPTTCTGSLALTPTANAFGKLGITLKADNGAQIAIQQFIVDIAIDAAHQGQVDPSGVIFTLNQSL